jgi:hypothetical protein
MCGSFSFIMAFIIVLINHSTRGTRQNNIKYVYRIRTIAPIRVFYTPKAENHPLNRSLESQPLQV